MLLLCKLHIYYIFYNLRINQNNLIQKYVLLLRFTKQQNSFNNALDLYLNKKNTVL